MTYCNLRRASACSIGVAALLAMGCGSQRVEAVTPIMSFEEYAGVQHDTPYVLHMTEGDLELTYYGARHSFDPADPMFDDMESRFAAMRPTIAFNEGGNPPSLSDRDAAIRNHGDPGFLRYLAEKYGVEARNLDLPDEEASRILTSTYTKPQVLLFYVVRQLGTYNNLPERPDIDAYLDDCIRNFGISLKMPEASLEIVEAEFDRTFGGPFVPETIGRDYSDPVRTEHLMQRIARDSSIARDEHMVNQLLEALHRDRRVFAIMGASHVVMQEPALRARLIGSRGDNPSAR